MINQLNISNIKKAHEKGFNGDWGFNCWGSTLFVLNQRKTLRWVSCKSITKFIDQKTFEPNDIKRGDILVLYHNNKITHTAVYLRKNLLWHKRGGRISEFGNEKNVKSCYVHNKSEIRRLKKD